MRGIMLQGTASDVGKSLITTAICRLLANEGMKVAPFKSQNMSNNSYITYDGKEIGRAQGLQAEAAKTEASVWMNPILLKPQANQKSEIVLFGEVFETVSGENYRDLFYEKGVKAIKEAFNQLDKNYDILVIEGAGSPVEMNLKDKELANMRVAELANVPVVLVADIDRGGVFASIVGTLELFVPEERKRVKGIIINKFRGKRHLFADGVRWIEERTGIPVLGVLPHVSHRIEGEDSLSLPGRFQQTSRGTMDLVVIKLPFISNYTDLEPFVYEEDVSLRLVETAEDFGNPDAVIIPGTKSTIADLQMLKDTGLYRLLKQYVEDGGNVVGICGGYQMLCAELYDPVGKDTGVAGSRAQGLQLIPAITEFESTKSTTRISGTLHKATGIAQPLELSGYEVHVGKTVPLLKLDGKPFLQLDNGKTEGYYAENGRIIGTYMHHVFHNDEWRNMWLNQLREKKSLPTKEIVHVEKCKDAKYDQLANNLLPYLDWQKVKEIMFEGFVHD